MKMESEFGQGLTYCLGLFLAHEWKAKTDKREYENLEIGGKPYNWEQLWFNGASDHFYELRVSEKLPVKLQRRIIALRKDALDLGHGDGLMGKRKVTEADVWRCCDEAKECLRAIDRWIGLKTIKGSIE